MGPQQQYQGIGSQFQNRMPQQGGMQGPTPMPQGKPGSPMGGQMGPGNVPTGGGFIDPRMLQQLQQQSMGGMMGGQRYGVRPPMPMQQLNKFQPPQSQLGGAGGFNPNGYFGAY
jgi:hypothetical protein